MESGERMEKSMKKFCHILKTLTIIAVIGIVIYKAYEYFAKDDKLEDFEEDEDEIPFADEEDKPLKKKIKDVAKKVIH